MNGQVSPSRPTVHGRLAPLLRAAPKGTGLDALLEAALMAADLEVRITMT